MKKKLTRLFSVLLAAVLVLGTLPVSAMGTDVADPPASAVDDTSVEVSAAEPEEQPAVDDAAQPEEQSAEEENVALQADKPAEFMRIFHLDCGRKYFSVDQIKALIDQLAANNFTHMELAVGNDGLRFLLDDMSVTANGTTYSSDDVKSGIQTGNQNYYNDNELTQSEMNAIISYAKQNGISIIPLLNSPGHMDAILDCMEALGLTNVAYNDSARTVDVTNTAAVTFTQELIKKYINYFAAQGCKYFNIGADEYANDVSNGFAALISGNQYDSFVKYVNTLATAIKANGMTPMAFNDGIYYNSCTSGGTFDKDIVVCYWTSGWGDYSPASAAFLKNKEHQIINTNDGWYYVLGRRTWINTSYNLTTAQNGAQNTTCTDVPGENDPEVIGCMQCLWCDTPSASYSSDEVSNVNGLIQTLAKNNPNYFKAPTFAITTEEGATPSVLPLNGDVTLTVGEEAVWTADSDAVTLKSADAAENAVSLAAETNEVTATKVRVTAAKTGTATITATSTASGKTTSVTLTVNDPTQETVEVPVGGTKTITVVGNVSDEYTTDNSGIATVSTKYTTVDGETLSYTASVKATMTGYSVTNGESYPKENLIDGDTSTFYWGAYRKQAVGDYVQVDLGAAIPFDTVRLTTPKDSGDDICDNADVLVSANGTDWTQIGSYTGSTTPTTFTNTLDKVRYIKVEITVAKSNWWQLSEIEWGNTVDGEFTRMPASGTVTTEAKDETEITFTGVSVGTTTVEIAGVTYTINVVDKAPNDALIDGTLKLEYWITNYRVHEKQANTGSTFYTIYSKNAITDDGVSVATLAQEHAYSNFDGWKDVYYWQTMRLDSDHKQTVDSRSDQTAAGTTLTHVRYKNNAWQYKTADGVWHYFQSGDQLVAYYLQKTDVTKEITTYVKDWGYSTDETTDNTSSGKGQVALTVAVVYPDGTVSPAEGELYDNSTTIFNYWDNRDIGIVSPTNNSDYTISKITVTDGKRDKNTDAVVWYPTDTITWDKKANENGEKWYDETTVWDETQNAGTTPMVNGKNSNITWSAKNTAKLVLIYLKPIEKESNLIVRYWNSSSNEEITHYQVAMTYNQGDPEPSFTSVLKDGDGNVIGDNKEWSGKTSSEKNYLPDEAYVTNSSNINQKFNKTLSAVPGVSEKYKSGVYSYNGADISEDGKTLTLYYVVDQNKTKADYVLDFGTPVQIPMSDFVKNWENLTGVTWNDNELKAGTLSYNEDSKVITYTPKKVLEGYYALNFKLEFKDNTSGSVTIGVMPASNVLYEENFLTGADGWTDTKTGKHTDAQETQKTTDTDKSVFGYDDTYKDVTDENGAWEIKDLIPKKLYSPLTTEFYGNTFDLIGNCGPTTGRVMLVFKNQAGKYAAIVDIDTRYNGGNIYQVPLAHITLGDGTDANYSVSVYASGLAATGTATTPGAVATMSLDDASVENDELLAQVLEENDLTLDEVEYTSISAMDTVSAMDVPDDGVATYAADTGVEHQAGDHVEINGFRVYRSTASTDAVAQNYPEGEKDVTYKNIIKVVDNTIVAYTEGDPQKKIAVKQYEAAGGPQNEIYLGESQSVSFGIEGVDQIQVSLRAVGGETQWNTKTISSNTEMYYTLKKDSQGLFTISNTGSSLLAIGNVKVPENAGKVTYASDIDYDTLLASIKASYGAGADEPAEVFTPETFTAKTTSTKVIRNKVVTLKVNVSSDVAYVTVNGVKYTRTGLQGLFQKTRTIRVVKTVPKNQTKTYEIIAYNADGVASETITVTG